MQYLAIVYNCAFYLCITSLNKDNIFLLILPQLFYEIFFLKVVDFKTNLLHVKGHEVYFSILICQIYKFKVF